MCAIIVFCAWHGIMTERSIMVLLIEADLGILDDLHCDFVQDRADAAELLQIFQRITVVVFFSFEVAFKIRDIDLAHVQAGIALPFRPVFIRPILWLVHAKAANWSAVRLGHLVPL